MKSSNFITFAFPGLVNLSTIQGLLLLSAWRGRRVLWASIYNKRRNRWVQNYRISLKRSYARNRIYQLGQSWNGYGLYTAQQCVMKHVFWWASKAWQPHVELQRAAAFSQTVVRHRAKRCTAATRRAFDILLAPFKWNLNIYLYVIRYILQFSFVETLGRIFQFQALCTGRFFPINISQTEVNELKSTLNDSWLWDCWTHAVLQWLSVFLSLFLIRGF